MKIVADEDMVNVRELFAPFGDVVALRGREICAADLRDADALLVRSVSRVDARLLKNSPVKFVGSATSGADHVDQAYLAARGIEFANAPGCNARAVVQYVVAALCAGVPDWRQRTVGIVGCGQVGGRLYRCLTQLGVSCRVYDPFLDGEGIADQVSFEDILCCEIICLHTPLIRGGPHPTWHLIDRNVLERLAPGTVLLNAGRGAVVDNRALRAHLTSGAELGVILDVWESEPDIDIELLGLVLLGTPHIAGYSVEGRLAGTLAIRDAFCQWQACEVTTTGRRTNVTSVAATACADFTTTVLSTWDIGGDHRRMLTTLTQPDTDVGAAFDQLRRQGAQRREFSYYRISAGVNSASAKDLEAVGFVVTGENQR